MARHIVAKVGDVPPNGSKLVTVRGRQIALFNVNETYYALTDRCPHEGGSLCAGLLVGRLTSKEPGTYDLSRPREFVQCSWHGWEFDIRTGQSYCDPEGIKARTYQVTVEPGTELAKGPFLAETFPVTVEDQYILIDV
ncbi:MAG: Rieske (2Fe-2S) protein [Roseomonas sp.]|nr:Rieske (2Fe-2S) protein [Roseomonas sp.]MCA3286291.1 Rieske (2Fe-2S) protein [Roseomonas sp.]MCA3291208.1 Rieske (2Fe-2S) protein [Roseomonas sp.]MCA3296397.1 Rieske (2Fe-2S) protein [Roseomonas sp.]